MTDFAKILASSTQISDRHPALRLLVLFGSRARGDHDSSSDWDIAFLSDPDASIEHPPFWLPDLEILTTLGDFAGIP
jgi:predicted nucleotidyltransferase